MDVFAFRDALVADYARFSRSFTKIRAADIADKVKEADAGEQFWPPPRIELNPHFAPGGWVDELVAAGTLEPECERIFRLRDAEDSFGKRLLLHRHQADAIDIAGREENYALTTGTGSGKSLAYFIPIVNHVLRRRRAGETRRGISAIVVYPMNALCNSQYEELERYLGEGPEAVVTFARYTGQDSHSERERIAQNPPDILLTNYVMLELIMTRFIETDKKVREHAAGLRFLVLDELHTYRGRQGADVAMLVRRVRERFNDDLLCIGTSATMAPAGPPAERKAAVARAAGRIFGATVQPENVVSETLQRRTDPAPVSEEALCAAMARGVPTDPTHEELAAHPVAAWVEQNLGTEERGGALERISQPRTIAAAAGMLAADSGLEAKRCGDYLAKFLLAAHGADFFAFRLHQFISGAGNAYTTLLAPGERYLTLNGQQFEPGERGRRLFPLVFCRKCGQEYLPVWAEPAEGAPARFEPRDPYERVHPDADLAFGYLVPEAAVDFDPEEIEAHYPEGWLTFDGGAARIKPHYRKFRPQKVQVDTGGAVSAAGLPAWFIPGAFRFCLHRDCDAHYDGRHGEFTKLSGLLSEGRSSATTVVALSALRHLTGSDLPKAARKLLAFTDNRQDASLQAGHFNDFVQILLLRGALLGAIRTAGDGFLTDETLTQGVFDRLGLTAADYAANPAARGLRAAQALKTLRDVLGYRLYADLRRGWRINNPNLEQLKLLEIGYRGLMECCADPDAWDGCHPLLGAAPPARRHEIACELLDRMRRALCIKTIYLDPDSLERLRNRSYNELKEPWGLAEEERTHSHLFMVPRPAGAGGGGYRTDPSYLRPLRVRPVAEAAGALGAGEPALSGAVRRRRLQPHRRRGSRGTDDLWLCRAAAAGGRLHRLPHPQRGARMAARRGD